MNEKELAELEQQLGLKLPKAYIEFIQKYQADCSNWPENSGPGTCILTDVQELIQLNRSIRQSPDRFVTTPVEYRRRWPDHLLIFGKVGNELLDVIDVREARPRLQSLYNKQLGESAAKKNLVELYQLLKWQHEGAWKNYWEEQREAERRAKAEQKRASRPSRPTRAEPDLIAGGHRLARPALALKRNGEMYVAVWGGTGVVPHAQKGPWEHVISIACSALPQNPHALAGVISLYRNVGEELFGKPIVAHDPTASLPATTDGEKLFGHPFDCLPPVEAVLYRGENEIQEWVDEIGWTPDDDYPLLPPVEKYMAEFTREHPMYSADCDAMLGGWAVPFPEGDWKKFVNKPLFLLTFRNAEPYYELWGHGRRFQCVERIT